MDDIIGSIDNLFRETPKDAPKAEPQARVAPPAEPAEAVTGSIDNLFRENQKRSADEIVQRGQFADRDWSDTAAELKKSGYKTSNEMGTQYEQQRGLKAERIKQGQGVSFADQAVRNLIPWGSSVINSRRESAYADATKRYQDGKASQEDYETIAAHDRRAAADQKINSTTAGQLLNIPLQAPAIIGEAYGGGKLIGAAGKALGVGQAAAQGTARTVMNFAGKQALTTPLMPSMYLQHANQTNIEAGRDPNDVRGFAPALGLAYANNLVLGSLQKYGSGGNLLQQAAKKGAIGVGEQAAADVVAGGIDEFLPDAYKMKTRYGVLGDLARGDVSKGLGHATIQALTFSYFSALHGKSPDKVKNAFGEYLDASHNVGDGPDKAAEAANKVMGDLYEHLKGQIADAAVSREKTFTREDARDFLDSKYFDAIADNMHPEQAKAFRKLMDGLAETFDTRADAEAKDAANAEAMAKKKTPLMLEGRKPEAEPQVSETTPEAKPPVDVAPKPVRAAGPDWLSNNMDAHLDTAKRAGVVDRIVELASQGKVAKEIAADIADKLPADADSLTRGAIVAAVRNRFKIPSANEPAELAKWNADRATKISETKPVDHIANLEPQERKDLARSLGYNEKGLTEALKDPKKAKGIQGLAEHVNKLKQSTETAPRGERSHTANYKDPSRSVDKAIEMMEKRGSAPLPLETWQDPVNAKGQAAKGTASFVLDTNHYSGEIHGRQGIDNLRNSKYPLPYDPALKKVVYKGDASEPGYAKLHEAVQEMNKRRADEALMRSVGHTGKLPPVRIEVSGEGPMPTNRLQRVDRRHTPTEGHPARREGEANHGKPDPEVVKAAHESAGDEGVKAVTELHEELHNGTGDLAEATKAAAEAVKEVENVRREAIGDPERGVDRPGEPAVTGEPVGDRGRGLAAEAESSGIRSANADADRTRDQAAAQPRKPRQAKGTDVKKEPKPAKKTKAEPKPVKAAKDVPIEKRVRDAKSEMDKLRAAAEVENAKFNAMPHGEAKDRYNKELEKLDAVLMAAREKYHQALDALADQNGTEFAVHIVDGPGAAPREVSRHTSLHQANVISRSVARKEFRGESAQHGGRDIKNELGEKLNSDGRPNSAERHTASNGKQVYVSRVDRAPKPAPESARKSPKKKPRIDTVADAVRDAGGIKFDSAMESHFKNQDDAVKNGGLGVNLFSKKGRSIDQLAQELKRHTGSEDPQDLINALMDSRPSRLADRASADEHDLKEHLENQQKAHEADPKGRIMDKVREMIDGDYANLRMVPMWELRKELGMSRDAFKEHILDMRRTDQLRLVSADDRSRYTPEQLKDSIHAVGETFIYAEPGPKAPERFNPNAEIPFSRGTAGEGTESHRLVAEQNKLFGNPNYVEKGVPSAPSDVNAAARLQERATVTRKLSAGDAEVNLEEHAHHLQRQYGLPTDPAALPSAVAKGIQAFFSYRAKNYGVSETTPSRTGMIEGFADWLIARSKGGLTGLSPAQEVANKYLEKWAAEKGLTEKFDKLKGLYKDFHGQAPEAKAAGLVSSTGQPEAPPKTIKEAAQDLANKAQESIDDSLAVLNRIGADAEANGAPKGLAKRVRAIWSQLMYADPHRAAEFERDGVHTYEDGRKKVIGLPFEKIVEGAKPEWLQPGENGGASRAGVYALARHLLGEEARGETDRVSKEQLEVYRAAFEEMGKDKEFSDWAKGFAERLTAANNASLDALAGEGVKYYSKDQVGAMKKKYPDYAELSRVMQDAGWKTGGGARGAGPKTMTGERSGSGEQIVDPLISYKNRLRATSAVMGEQLRFLETRKFAPYVGNWMLSSGVEQRTKLGDVRAEVLEKLGFKGTALENTLKAMGADRAEDYFRNAPWPVDGTKPTYTRMYDGKPESYRVGNRDFYNLITGQQTDASATASWLRATANFLPIKWMTQAVKFGATSASLGFQFRNVPRDIYTFWANTIDRAKANPRDLGDAYKRAFAYSWHQLTDHFGGGPSQDALYKRFAADRGLDQRQFTFEKDNPASAYAPSETKGIKEAHTVWGILKDVLNLAGAGENAPRFLEWKTRLERTTGKSSAELTKELEAAEAAQKAGKPIADPIPFHQAMDAMEHAAEVTVNFNRLGTVTREVNKITPFFGPAIAGLSKSVRNWKENPKGAAFAMSGLLAARLLHWAMFSDEDWYKELNSNDRYNNFVVPTPAGLRRLPAPRDLEVAGGGLLILALDAAAGKNPDFKGLLRESLGAVAPPAPVPPAAKTGYEIARNENWQGSPIVPKRDENKSVQDKWTEGRAPYAADQLTGGLLSARKIPSEAKDLIPYSEVKNARRSVDDFYERLHDMEEQRNKALKQGKRFEQQAEYHRLNAAQEQIVTLGRAVRGDRMVNGRAVKGEPPTPEKAQELRAKQIQVARKALGTE